MQINTLFLPNPGTVVIHIPNNLSLKIAEILPAASAVTSITQRVGQFTNSYTIGGTLYGGLPATFVTNAACTISFDGVGQFAIVTAAADMPYDSAAMLDTGTTPPRIVRRRADGSYWYGTPFSSTP